MKKEKGLQRNTIVLDSKDGLALEHVDKPQGRLWRYGKSMVHLMRRHNGVRAEGETNTAILEAISLPAKMGETPEKLFRALFWEKEAEILFTLRNTLLEKLNTIAMFVLIGILLLFTFLIFSSLLG
jgi:hypothetical protein